MATIREKGYYHWDGRLETRRFPWWPITWTGIKLAFRKRGFRFLFAFEFLPAVIFMAYIYGSENLENFKFMVRGSDRVLAVTPGSFKLLMTFGPVLFLIVMMLVFAGAGLIADDLKHNSLQIYFARPLRKREYLMGKMAVVFFFVLVVTAAPGVICLLFKLVLSGSFKFFFDFPWLILSILGYSAVLAVFFAFYTLLLSALNTNSRFAMILIFLTYIFSDILAAVLRDIFRTPYMALFSIRANLEQVGSFLFAQKLAVAIPVGWSFVVLAAVCGLSAVVLDRKIRAAEVIR